MADAKEYTRDNQTGAMAPTPPLVINLHDCHYAAVRDTALSLGFTCSRSHPLRSGFNLFWTDRSVTVARTQSLSNHQIVNHFPGMVELFSKSRLAINLRKMSAQRPADYDYIPESWIVPEEYPNFVKAHQSSKKEQGFMFIVKPERGAQGKGIFLTSRAKDRRLTEAYWKLGDVLVVQPYLQDPFLIDGFKFDLRLYILVTCCDPLRVYLFHDGLARLCTERYQPANEANKGNFCMHLTNYSINRLNKSGFHESLDSTAGGVGSKRTISALLTNLRGDGFPGADTLWTRLQVNTVRNSCLGVGGVEAAGSAHRAFVPVHGCDGWGALGRTWCTIACTRCASL